jgi:ABC-2 type transport system ATP-binding protein
MGSARTTARSLGLAVARTDSTERADQRRPDRGTIADAMSIDTPPVTDSVIAVRGLTKRYGDTQAVAGIDFDVRKGEVFGLLGPNGAGKTTTVEILEGLRTPDGGEARVLGVDVAKEPDTLKPRIGVSLQTAALYPKLTVTEVIDLFRSFYASSRPTADLIDALELGERRNAQTSVLSGGQRQRLAVALALVNDPELVFLDEPTTGLDPAARRSLWDLVLGMKSQGRTVLLTTHYMEEAEVLCDRLAIMDHGRILEMGTVDELVSKRFHERAVRFDATTAVSVAELERLPAVRSVKDEGEMLVYTTDVGTTIGALLALAEARGVELGNLAIRRATLEDVFLDLTGRALRD